MDNIISYTCKNCNTSFFSITDKNVEKCVFCDNEIEEKKEIENNDNLPLKLLPFFVSKEDAFKVYLQHIKKNPIISTKFKNPFLINDLKKIYVPLLLYSFDNIALANVFAENKSISRENNDKIQTNHQYNILFSTATNFSYIPIFNNKDELIDIENYNFKNLIDCNPENLMDAYIKFPTQNKNDVDEIIKEMSKNYVQNQILDNSDDYPVKAISEYKNNYVNEKVDYALLPLWLLNVEYNNQKYCFYINGSNGKLKGVFPFSLFKTFGLFYSIFLITQLIFMLIRFVAFVL